jgi:hypothetical protein
VGGDHLKLHLSRMQTFCLFFKYKSAFIRASIISSLAYVYATKEGSLKKLLAAEKYRNCLFSAEPAWNFNK